MRSSVSKTIVTLAIVFVASALVGCASVEPFTKSNSVSLAEDEQRIWNRSLEEVKRLDQSGQLYSNLELVSYVNWVARRLVPEDLRSSGLEIRVRIIKNPLLNAFAMANGTIYLHSGLLAKIENEAQLATLLAHELTHVTHRHMIQHFRTTQNVSSGLAVLQIALLRAGAFGNIGALVGVLGATAAVSGYSRSMEREADTNGLALLVKAEYDPTEGSKLFEFLQAELKDRKIEEPFFFGSHPNLEDRKDTYKALLAGPFAGKTGQKGSESYAEYIGPLLLENAQMDLSLGRWVWAESAIRRFMALRSESPQGYFFLGELYRRRMEDGDSEKAEQSYQAAIAADSSFAPAHRGLGTIYLKMGLVDKSQASFETYLRLMPNAEDRGYIEPYLLKKDTAGAMP